MSESIGDTTHLVNRLRQGDEQARNDLIAHANQRLLGLATKMLKTYPGVGRWEQADDVCQKALLRLYQALSKATLESSRHFWNLAALEIRRELIDLARHYQGPEGQGANHYTDGGGKAADDQGGPLQVRKADEGEPSSLEEWTHFHQEVERLPDEERDVFSLIFYDGLTQVDAARELGISLRTLKRHWQSARFSLDRALSGKMPK